MNKFNIRVYGICINEDKVLVTDEYRYGYYITKFPGGGLEFGEGTIDCLKRELKEEFNQEVKVEKHFYTTDFFQASAFNNNQQLISIYYTVKIFQPSQIPTMKKKFDFAELKEGAQIFRWLPLDELITEDFTFPIDKKVAELLKVNERV